MTNIDAAVLNFSPDSMLILNGVLAIVMFAVALDITPNDFRALLRTPKPFATGIVSQFFVLPALTFLLVLAVRPQGSVALGLILVAACPGGNISNYITHRAGGNAALAVSLTAFTTIGTVLFTPLNIAFWGSLYGPSRTFMTSVAIDPVQVAATVSLMLGLAAAGVQLGPRLMDSPELESPVVGQAVGVLVVTLLYVFLLWTPRSSVVLSDHYRDVVIPRTPHAAPRSILRIVAVILFLTLVGVLGAVAWLANV